MRYFPVVIATALIAACSGSNNGSAPGSSLQPVSTDLIGAGALLQNGTITDGVNNHHKLWGIVAPLNSLAVEFSGMGRFWMSDSASSTSIGGKGAVLAAPLLTATGGSDFSSALVVFANADGTLIDNVSPDKGGIEGTVNSVSITGTYTLTGNNDSGSFSAYFDSSYDTAYSLSDIAGTYTLTFIKAGNGGKETTLSLSIAANSTISSASPDSDGCSYNGSIVAVDGTHNVFGMKLTQNCRGSAASTMTGLASYVPATNFVQAQLEIIVLSDNGSTGLAAIASQ